MKPDETDLVGRGAELRLLDDFLARIRSGAGALLMIDGEAGSGKSRLLDELTGRAGAFSIFSCVGHAIERDRPFGVFRDALAIDPVSPDPARAEIARMVRESDATTGSEIRFRVAEDLAELVERETTNHPVLLVVDDLQWADESSILTLHLLARRITHLSIGIVTAHRPEPSPVRLSDLERLTEVQPFGRISLAPLDDESVALLARQSMGALPGARLRALLAGAAGNPFFVTELLSALRRDGSIRVGPGGAEIDQEIPRPDLSLVILRHLSTLPRETVSILRTAAILGTSFAPADLARVLGTSAAGLTDTLEPALKAGVLTDAGRLLRFRHDLVREALYGDLSASIRAALHRDVALALIAAGAPAEQVAPHFAVSGSPGDATAIEWLRRAAREIAHSAPGTAVSWLQRSLELTRLGEEQHDEIAAELCPLLSEAGRFDDAGRLAEAVLRRTQPPERRAALRRAVARMFDHHEQCVDAAAQLEAESALEDQPDVERVRLAAEAVEYRSHVEAARVAERAQDVLDWATRLSDDRASAWVLSALYHTAVWTNDWHRAVGVARQGVEHARRLPPYELPWWDELFGRALAWSGRVDEGLDVLRRTLHTYEAGGLVALSCRALFDMALVDWQLGRWDEAVAGAEASVQAADDIGSDRGRQNGSCLLAMIAARRNDPVRAAALLDDGWTLSWMLPWSMATVQEVQGDPAAARRTLRDGWDRAIGSVKQSSLIDATPDLIRLEMLTGNHTGARALAETVEDLASGKDVAWLEALALRCRGGVEGDPETLLVAAARAENSGRPDLRAFALEDAGVLLGRFRSPGDGVPLITEALEFYERAGAAWDGARATAALRSLGVRPGKRGPRGRAATGWGSLTETETRVAELAAERLTNAEIGSRMFLSPRTVERHLTHVYAKLGLSSRLELIALIARGEHRS